MNTDHAIVLVKQLTKSYRLDGQDIPVLDRIDARIDEGEFVALMGPSGSGKSTLMNIIGCLDVPSSGEFIFRGRNIEHCDDTELSHIRKNQIGFVFQNFNLLPRLNAVENVELPLVYSNVPRRERQERAQEMLRRVGLIDRAMHRPNEMSGGQKQRVAIARALINNPALILADEPTGNLDSRSGAAILDILVGLHEEGRTILIVTHDEGVAANAGRRIHLHDGSILTMT